MMRYPIALEIGHDQTVSELWCRICQMLIVLPRWVLFRWHALAKAHGESRLGYTAHLAMSRD